MVLGLIQRLALPEGGSETILLRSYTVCCATDAGVAGFRLRGEGVSSLDHGEWMVVAGTLQPRHDPLDRMRGRASRISDQFDMVVTDAIKHTDTLPALTEKLSSERIARFAHLLYETGLKTELEGEGPSLLLSPGSPPRDRIGRQSPAHAPVR